MKLSFFRLLLILLAVMRAPALWADDEPKISVLIVDGFSNHNWRLNTALIEGILETAGLFDVSVSTAPPRADSMEWEKWRPAFENYDVVIQTCNDIGGGPSWPPAVRRDFENYVRNGGGVFVYHSGNNAFADWDAYNRMIGLGWRKAGDGVALTIDDAENVVRIPIGQGRDTGHGPRVDAVITRLGEHPIHAGLPRQWKTPDIEIYYYPRGPAENIQVISYTHDEVTDMRWPIEWTVSFGKGRIYTATYGHVWHDDDQPERMRCAGVQTMITRALLWLADREIDPVVPDDFPTPSAISIRGEIPLP